MQRIIRTAGRFACFVMLAALFAPDAGAATKYWSGTGTWNAGNANWGASPGGPYNQTFNTGDDAVFEGTAGDVTVSSPNNPKDITFKVTGYTLSGGTMTFFSHPCNITTDPNVSATISSQLSGSPGLDKEGAGTLTLSNPNNNYGAAWQATIINGGTLKNGASEVIPHGVSGAYVALYTGGIWDLNGFDETIRDLGGSAAAGGIVLNNGSRLTIIQDVSVTWDVPYPISGSGGLTLTASTSGRSTRFNNVLSYTGDTILTGTADMRLTKDSGGPGGTNPDGSLSLGAGTTYDVSNPGTPEPDWLLDTTSLIASGTGTGVGSTAAAIKGSSGYTVSVSIPITLNYNGVNPALYLSQGTLSLNANAFTVNTASPLADGAYTIAQQASGNVAGAGPYPPVTGTAIGIGKKGEISVSGGNVILTISTAATPTIVTAGTLGAVDTTYGSPSPTPTSFTVSGTNLTAGITVTPPAGYEVSTSIDSGYAGSGTAITVGSAPTVPATTIYVRLAATAGVGSYSGDIVCSSAGATSQNVPTVSSTVIPFTIASMGIQGSGIVFEWQGSDAWTYTVEYTPSLLPPVWLPLPGYAGIPGTNGTMYVTDTTADMMRFYHIKMTR